MAKIVHRAGEAVDFPDGNERSFFRDPVVLAWVAASVVGMFLLCEFATFSLGWNQPGVVDPY